MVDPNRKININLPSDEDSSSEDEDLNEEHVKLVKEFEEEFKDRFTEKDEEFMNFCSQKKKPPIIVYPFDNFFRHNNRGFNRNHHFNKNQRNNHHHHYNQNRNRNYNNQNRNSYGRDNRYGDAKRFKAE